MSSHRIGIAFFYHESNAFSPVPTDCDAFVAEAYYKGEDIVSAYENTRTELGAFIDVLQQNHCSIQPLLCAAAIPSGTVTADAYEQIKFDMLFALKEVGHLDGLLLALHGAMVVDGVTDPELELLGFIREAVGPHLPIATTLDLHANLNSKLLQHTPMHFGFQTYPHIDMYEQGVRAANTLLNVVEKGTKYYGSFVKLPMMPPSINMRTAEGPMHDVVELAKTYEANPDITGVSIFGGFPYSDVPETGCSVLVVSTEKTKGDHVALVVARALWDSRQRFLVGLPTVEDGIQEILKLHEPKPVVLADVSDNPLSGGSGDTTLLLRTMLDHRLKRSLFGALYDAESLAICQAVGAGAEVELQLGGKTSPEFGKPILVHAKVVRITDGIFVNKGPMNMGRVVNTKGAAHIKVDDIDILITGRALTANDPELFRHIGIEPTQKLILGLKVKNHFRAAFDPLVSKVIYVDAPGVASNDLSNFEFKRIPRPIWPLDEIESPEIKCE